MQRGFRSWGLGINNFGQVVGWSPDDGRIRAFLWADGSMYNLGTIGDEPNGNSIAQAINDSSAIVGVSPLRLDPETVATHAFLSIDGEMTDLGTLGDPINLSWATAIGSGAGHVVGETESADGHFHAFLWTNSGGMVDLGTLMGGSDAVAYGIDDSDGDRVVGTSAGRAFIWSDGEMRELL